MCKSQADGVGGVLGMLVSRVYLPLGDGLQLWSICIEDFGLNVHHEDSHPTSQQQGDVVDPNQAIDTLVNHLCVHDELFVNGEMKSKVSFQPNRGGEG